MRRIYVGDGAPFVWQWQPKEHIVLEGYPDGVFVRYSNCDTVEAPVVQTRREGDKLVADIPPELMQVDKDITVYVCNEDGIIHCHFLSVISSPKPSSYIYEPVEVLRYESLAERIRLVEEWIANGDGGGGIQEETDPTVPDWAKQPQKPPYTAQEVGAMPAGTKIPVKTSDLTNDSGFITKSVADLVNYYTKAQTEELISQIPKFRISVVQQLPTVGEELVLYLVPFATAEGQYLEYIWVDGRFETIGSQKVDLTGYATEEWVQQGYQPKGNYLTQHQDISHLLPRAELPGAVATQIQAFEQGHDLELITSFQLTEAVSSLDITADANGEPFELEAAVIELHTGTDGSCGEGSSGSVQINFGEAKYPYHLRLMDASGFPYRGTANGTAYRDTGFTAYATTRNKLGLCGGYTGAFNSFDAVMLTMQNYKYLDSPISRINALGNLPVNAAISVYGVRRGENA